MAETQFEKTTDLALDKVIELIDDYGLLKLSKAPVGQHIIAKILEPVSSTIVGEGTDDEFTVTKVKVEYEPKGYEPATFEIQVGEGAVNRMTAKFPDDKYVGMQAFFKRSKFAGKYPQHINPFVASEGGPGTKPQFIKKSNSTGIPSSEKKEMDDQPEFVKQIIVHFCGHPDEFKNNFMTASARDGVTAPWEFIDNFNEAAKEDGTEYTREEILAVYNVIVTAVATL